MLSAKKYLYVCENNNSIPTVGVVKEPVAMDPVNVIKSESSSEARLAPVSKRDSKSSSSARLAPVSVSNSESEPSRLAPVAGIRKN